MRTNNPAVVGQRFGRLVVVEVVSKGGGVVRCVCDCGAERGSLQLAKLRAGKVVSCGCHQRSLAKMLHTTHGMRGTRTYRSWQAMKARCTNRNSADFAKYGARGVAVCERWMVFETFLADMGERPEGTSIDRIDGSGDYEPGNCRWASATQQAVNRRSTRLRLNDIETIWQRMRAGHSQAAIAAGLGVAQTTVGRILRGKGWRLSLDVRSNL